MAVHLISNNKSVNDLWLDGIKTTTLYKGADVVVSGGVTVIKSKAGKLHTNLRRGAYAPSNWCFNDGLMKCLLLLGHVSEADVEQHKALCERKSEASNARYDKELLLRTCKKHKVKPPKALVKKLNAAIDRGG
jgi:hypothetical protein